MQSRRLLFVQSPHRAGLAPIYLAILALLLASVLGFALASWPSARGPAPQRDGHREAAPAEPSTGGLTGPAERSRARPRLRSI